MGCTDRLILFPSKQPIPMPRITRMDVAVPGSGTVEVWTARSVGAARIASPAAYVLVFIGNADRAEPNAYYAAEEWGDRPVEVWAVNYPGYGGSSGSARLASIGPSALAAYDALAQHAGGKPIFVQAQSIGTAAALHVAANRPVAGCILKNPPPLRSLILGRFGWWNLWLLATPVALSIPSDLDSIANAKRSNMPAIFLLADSDEVVPPRFQTRVVDAYAGEKRAIAMRDAHHNDPVEGVALSEFKAQLDWLCSREVEPRR